MRRVWLSRSSMGRALVGSVFVAVGTLSACSKEEKTPGQLVVAIDADMALPEQIDTIEIQVTSDGTTLLDYPMAVGTGIDAQPIPATLTLVAADSSARATIRVLGWRNGVPRTLRQVTTTIPSDRLATLRMPVQWLCDGTARPTADTDGGAGYESTCGPDATCQAGKCVASTVDPTTLPEYQAESVFGGGSAPSAKGKSSGTCFDTIACLVGGQIEPPDDQCTVAIPAGSTNVNVGLRVANDGICDTTGATCFVPLDEDKDDGWSKEAGRIALPPPVCTKLQEGLIAGVVVSTTCPTKTQADPPCGPWSSVTLSAEAAAGPVASDAGPPPTPSLVASAAPDSGTTVACCPLMADGNKLYTCLCDGASKPQIVAIDPTVGTTTRIGTISPEKLQAEYAAVVHGTDLYWLDRSASADSGNSCPVYATSTSDAATGSPLAVANADVYLNGARLLADPDYLFALADSVSGVPATAAPVQLLRIALDTGVITPLDTGGSLPVFQFTQDPKSVYVAVDTEVAEDAGVERLSRVVQLPKNGDPSTEILRNTVMTTGDTGPGGTIGLEDDGTSLFSLFQAGPLADGTVDTRVLKLGMPGAAPTVLYDEVLDPTIAQLRLLGAVHGAVLLVRDVTPHSEAGASSLESSVLVIPPGGGAPRIVASFLGDTPIFGVQSPSFTSDVFWLNEGGRIFRLPAAALR